MSIHSLPVWLTPFVGRTEEFAEIARLLVEPGCRLLTLTGLGGSGKTRFALEVARRQQEVFYPNSVYFVPLQPITASEFILTAVAEAITIQFYPGIQPKQQLFDYLQDKACLIVLDNFEHLIDGAPLLSEILAHVPNIRFLITSRERLNLVEEWVLDMSGLAYPLSENEVDTEHYSAVELFVYHAQRIKVGFKMTDANRRAIVQICRLVEGLPLAIELAANWVRSLSCETIRDEIQRGLDILQSSVRNIEPRHRTMWAVFNPTWTRLSDHEREVFMRLSVFRGFTLDAAATVAGASIETISALVDKSLLQVDANGHYNIHQLLRQYAEVHLKAEEKVEVTQQAHATFYAAFLQQQWYSLRNAQQIWALNTIQMEFDNVRLAWQMMVETYNTAQIFSSVYSLWLFSHLRGRYDDASQLFSQCYHTFQFGAHTNPDAKRILGQMLIFRGWFYVSLGKIEEAQHLAQAGLTTLEQVGTLEDIVLAWHTLSLICAVLNDGAALRQIAEREVELAQQIDDDWFYTLALLPMGNADLYLGNLDTAVMTAQEFYDHSEACGDLFLRGCSAVMLADIMKLRNEDVKAQMLHEQALKHFESIAHLTMIAHLRRELGIKAFQQKAYSTAAYFYRESLKTFIYGREKEFILLTVVYIAELWATLDEIERAVFLLAAALNQPSIKLTLLDQDKARHNLQCFQAKLSVKTGVAAFERGMQTPLETILHECVLELDWFIETATSPISSTNLKSPVEFLSPRELDVLRLVAVGYSNQEIADRLFIGISTVKKHINHIYDKLQVKNRTQAVANAREHGLLG